MGEDFDGQVDDQCVERALKSVSPEITRTTYVSDGGRGFPSGTEVTQFNYPDPVTHNGYSLDLALLPKLQAVLHQVRLVMAIG